MCLQADAYAKVRGFPKKLAGEDFYLLNKLAKVGGVRSLQGPPIKLAGRTSGRVPFGTGVAIATIRDQLDRGQPYEVYNPQVFLGLKYWLRMIDTAGSATHINEIVRVFDSIDEPIGSMLSNAIDTLNYLVPVKRAIDEVRGEVRVKRLHDWNDAFRTLKLIHALRDEGLKNIPADQVLKPFMTEQNL